MARLEQVFLTTPSLERSRDFYEGVLGLDVERVGSSSVTYDAGGCVLKVQRDFGEAELAEFGLEPPGALRGEGAVVALGVDDVDAAAERAGEALVWGPGEVGWADRIALVESPAGYVFELRPAEAET